MVTRVIPVSGAAAGEVVSTRDDESRGPAGQVSGIVPLAPSAAVYRLATEQPLVLQAASGRRRVDAAEQARQNVRAAQSRVEKDSGLDFNAIKGASGRVTEAEVRRYFYQHRERVARGFVERDPRLSQHPDTVAALADEWVARNVARWNALRHGVEHDRLRVITAVAMLLAIEREVQDHPRAEPGLRAAVEASRQRLQANLEASGMSPDQARSYIERVARNLSRTTADYSQQLAALKREEYYRPLDVATTGTTAQREEFVPGGYNYVRPAEITRRQFDEPNHDARVRAERVEGNQAANARALARYLDGVAIARSLEEEGQPLGAAVRFLGT